MAYRRIESNASVVYVIGFIVILVAFFLLGGVSWLQGLAHTGNSMGFESRHGTFHSGFNGFANWNWPQILISLGLGFLLGLLVSRRR